MRRGLSGWKSSFEGVLSQDIFRIKPDDIPKTKVVYTIVGAKLVNR